MCQCLLREVVYVAWEIRILLERLLRSPEIHGGWMDGAARAHWPFVVQCHVHIERNLRDARDAEAAVNASCWSACEEGGTK
jgi:hypothetical protein